MFAKPTSPSTTIEVRVAALETKVINLTTRLITLEAAHNIATEQ